MTLKCQAVVTSPGLFLLTIPRTECGSMSLHICKYREHIQIRYIVVVFCKYIVEEKHMRLETKYMHTMPMPCAGRRRYCNPYVFFLPVHQLFLKSQGIFQQVI